MRIAQGEMLVKAGPEAHHASRGGGLDKHFTLGKEASIEVKTQTKGNFPYPLHNSAKSQKSLCMTEGSTLRLGRVVIDRQGIAQRPILFFFGKPFRLRWSEVTSWAVAEAVVLDTKTGGQRVDSRVLELHAGGKVHFISRGGRDPAFQRIVDAVRRELPEKEGESLMAAVSALRQGKADSGPA